MLLALFGCAGRAYAGQYTVASYNITATKDSVNTTAVGEVLADPGLAFITVVSVSYSEAEVVISTCPAGAYSVADSETCSLCVAGEYSSAVEATSVDTCVACDPGSYSNTTGAPSIAMCIPCPANTYFEGTGGASASVCLECPVHSSSYASSKLRSSCICDPGYAGPNGEFSPSLIRVFFISSSPSFSPPSNPPKRNRQLLQQIAGVAIGYLE